jgi:hypothetical protein
MVIAANGTFVAVISLTAFVFVKEEVFIFCEVRSAYKIWIHFPYPNGQLITFLHSAD